jgi:hypothetical protein
VRIPTPTGLGLAEAGIDGLPEPMHSPANLGVLFHTFVCAPPEMTKF